MKKILLFFAAMCCMMVANAQQFTDANGIKYKVTSTEDKTVEVIENNYSGSIVIPATVINGDVKYRVTRIGSYAFDSCEDLTSVTLPEWLESIGNSAFEDCYKLAIINIPSTVKRIGDSAFESCYYLTSINLPEGLESIEEEAFYYCESLTSINIPSSVTEIGEKAFYYCGLTSIRVAEGNTVYDSRNNCNAIIETETNTLILGSNTTVIPSSVTAIEEYAFSNCEELTTVTLPNGLQSIGRYAFYACDNLASISIPDNVVEISNAVFSFCENLTSVTLPDGLTSIGDYAFEHCALTSITIPNNVSEIGDNAFYYCEELTNVTLPISLESIGESAFCGCKALESITIPTGVTNIGGSAFYGCTGLTSITVLTSTPPTLGTNVFKNVTSIPVYVPDVTAYSNASWGGFTNFQAINIDDYKQAAKDEIEAAMVGISLSEEEEDAINACITAIEDVTTLSDENLATIENAKNAALTVISQAEIRPVREAAIAAIDAAMQGETSDYLTGLVQEYIDIINSATDETVINNAKTTAVTVLDTSIGVYKTIKAEALGSLGEKQDGPAVEVIDQDDNSVILYNPKKVNFIKVETEE